MKKYILKKDVTKKMLEEKGFVFETFPIGTIANKVLDDDGNTDLIIFWDVKPREVKFRFPSAYKRYSLQAYTEFMKELLEVLVPEKPHKKLEMSIDDWCNAIHKNAVEHGWWENDRNVLEIAALIHTEISEAVEEYRNDKPNFYEVNGKPEGMAVEMVDAVIRIMDWFGKQDISMEEILSKKHQYNLKRPYKHGGKKI